MDDFEDDPELAEALRQSLADVPMVGGSGPSPAASGSGGGSAAAPSVTARNVPSARIDLSTGDIVLLAGAAPRAGIDDLVMEDFSRIAAGRWSLGPHGRIIVAPDSGGGGRAVGLPPADALIKYCMSCRATIDGRFTRNAWTWRCALCEIDLCTTCYEGARACGHEYEGLQPGASGPGPRGPGRPAKPGRL